MLAPTPHHSAPHRMSGTLSHTLRPIWSRVFIFLYFFPDSSLVVSWTFTLWLPCKSLTLHQVSFPHDYISGCILLACLLGSTEPTVHSYVRLLMRILPQVACKSPSDIIRQSGRKKLPVQAGPDCFTSCEKPWESLQQQGFTVWF